MTDETFPEPPEPDRDPDALETDDERISREIREAADLDRPYTLELTKPIQLANGEFLTALTFASMDAGKMSELPVDRAQWNLGHFLGMAVRLTGQPPRVVSKLKGKDWNRAIELVAVFMGGSPETGE